MTSSLVGSEMCIRDRPAPGPWPGNSPNSPLPPAPKRPPPPKSHESRKAVSYTHLTLPTICSV
eukprot:597748-Prorocentrum_lima.AAC.1